MPTKAPDYYLERRKTARRSTARGNFQERRAANGIRTGNAKNLVKIQFKLGYLH